MLRQHPLRASHSLLLRYGIALISSSLALWLTLLLRDSLAEPKTLLLFLAAVMLSSWYGGLGPGLLATLFAALTGAYFFLIPGHSLTSNGFSTTIRLVEFVIVALLISSLNAARRADQRRAEKARGEADRANRVKDVFLAAATHELRTPIASMLGWAKLLRTGRPDDATFSRGLEAIERNARAQALLIDDLLDVSRIVTGNLRIDLRAVDPVQVIEAAIDTVRPAAKAKAIRLEVSLERSAGPVSGDPDRLQQVLWNLLSNAIKFTPDEGQIKVQLEHADSHARITVSDTALQTETLLTFSQRVLNELGHIFLSCFLQRRRIFHLSSTILSVLRGLLY